MKKAKKKATHAPHCLRVLAGTTYKTTHTTSLNYHSPAAPARYLVVRARAQARRQKHRTARAPVVFPARAFLPCRGAPRFTRWHLRWHGGLWFGQMDVRSMALGVVVALFPLAFQGRKTWLVACVQRDARRFGCKILRGSALHARRTAPTILAFSRHFFLPTFAAAIYTTHPYSVSPPPYPPRRGCCRFMPASLFCPATCLPTPKPLHGWPAFLPCAPYCI